MKPECCQQTEDTLRAGDGNIGALRLFGVRVVGTCLQAARALEEAIASTRHEMGGAWELVVRKVA